MGLLISNIAARVRCAPEKHRHPPSIFSFGQPPSFSAASEFLLVHRCILPMAPSAAGVCSSDPPGGASVPSRQTYGRDDMMNRAMICPVAILKTE